METVLQSSLPEGLWSDPRLGRLPGIQPVPEGGWLTVDDAFAGQMRLRARLIATRPEAVIGQLAGAEKAVAETLARVVEELRRVPGYTVANGRVRRPDGVEVPLTGAHDLQVLGNLCQEDFCILQKPGDEHVLTAAVLCFPASWRLDEKLGRPLTGIHDPVQVYDAQVARRVQRLFDGIRPDRALWRVNILDYDDPALFQPRSAAARRARTGAEAPFVRSERQCLVRLPRTGAVVFSIHSLVVRRQDLRPADRAALARMRGHASPGAGAAARPARPVR